VYPNVEGKLDGGTQSVEGEKNPVQGIVYREKKMWNRGGEGGKPRGMNQSIVRETAGHP